MINGVKEGLGKEFYKNGAIMYEGSYRNDEWHGQNVKIYHFDGELEYEGEILNGMREGYGKAYYEDGRLQYAGQWKEDKPSGNLIVIWNGSGSIRYEGVSKGVYLSEY